MPHLYRRTVGLGLSALVMLGLATVATPAYAATPITITATKTTISSASGEGTANITVAITGEGATTPRTSAQFLNGRIDPETRATVINGSTKPLNWGTFKPCETTVFTYRVYDTTLTADPTFETPFAATVNVTMKGDDNISGCKAIPPIDRETMTLTGDTKIGSTVNVVAKVSGELIGIDFDLWVCPDTTYRPRDDAEAEGANDSCVGPYIQEREGDSTTFLLGFDPVRDKGKEDESQKFWTATCGKFFVVHDMRRGGHSNWIGPIVCATDAETDTPTEDATDTTAAAAPARTLAATGATSIAGIGGLAAALALLVGGGLLVATRRRNAMSAE